MEGDDGAPLEELEIDEIKENLKDIMPFLREEGKKAMAELQASHVKKRERMIARVLL